ncbi:hypothetical protein HDU67_001371 [Dinochytrium kinnereticum]|nr:hypothetical protein HDU67_001371 [Dinochytrium kinnereticum]
MAPRTRESPTMPNMTATHTNENSEGGVGLPKLRVGCVPEHFSAPLYMGVKSGVFEASGVDVEIVNCPGGTGEMIRLLASGEIDVAAALTEGLIAPLARHLSTPSTCQDPGYRLIGTFTSKPLTWSIAVKPNSLLSSRSKGSMAVLDAPEETEANDAALDALRGARIGVSRFGSGSHIIPFVLAHQRGWVAGEGGKEEFRFLQLGDIKGLRNGVVDGTVDAFLWERFTTKPYYDSGELHHYANITPPWPAFLFAARTPLLTDPTTPLQPFLTSISTSVRLFSSAIHHNPLEAATALRSSYPFLSTGLGVEDLVTWMETVAYPLECGVVERGVVEECLRVLGVAGVVEGGVGEGEVQQPLGNCRDLLTSWRWGWGRGGSGDVDGDRGVPLWSVGLLRRVLLRSIFAGRGGYGDVDRDRGVPLRSVGLLRGRLLGSV